VSRETIVSEGGPFVCILQHVVNRFSAGGRLLLSLKNTDSRHEAKAQLTQIRHWQLPIAHVNCLEVPPIRQLQYQSAVAHVKSLRKIIVRVYDEKI